VELHIFLIILTLILVFTLALVAWFFPSNEDFRTDNPFWNGTKEIGANVLASPLESLSELPSLSPGSTLILIPYLDFTPTELRQLYSFVSEGGTLVLADDYGFGNQVLEYVGLKARFSGQVLVDPLSYYKNKRFPRVSHFIPNSITGNTESLVLNHATCLTNVETSDVLARTSYVSFLDLNGDWWYNKGEPTGSMPVISHHNLGRGQVILISDPSIFINSMQSMEGNQVLLKNIAAITRDKLFLDQSHLPPSNLHQTKTLLAAMRNFLLTPAGKVGLVVLALSITLIPVWYKTKEKEII